MRTHSTQIKRIRLLPKRPKAKSATVYSPKRRRALAMNRTTTMKPPAKPAAYHTPSSPDAYTAAATPRNEAAER